MQIRKAFKFELIPNGTQIREMKQFCGCLYLIVLCRIKMNNIKKINLSNSATIKFTACMETRITLAEKLP